MVVGLQPVVLRQLIRRDTDWAHHLSQAIGYRVIDCDLTFKSNTRSPLQNLRVCSLDVQVQIKETHNNRHQPRLVIRGLEMESISHFVIEKITSPEPCRTLDMLLLQQECLVSILLLTDHFKAEDESMNSSRSCPAI